MKDKQISKIIFDDGTEVDVNDLNIFNVIIQDNGDDKYSSDIQLGFSGNGLMLGEMIDTLALYTKALMVVKKTRCGLEEAIEKVRMYDGDISKIVKKLMERMRDDGDLFNNNTTVN